MTNTGYGHQQPIHQDGMMQWQLVLLKQLSIHSPMAGMFTGSEIKLDPNKRAIRVPEIRADDYIVDVNLSRIGASMNEGSAFVDEWRNGIPAIQWRTYSMSRHRSFGYYVMDEQRKMMAIDNLDTMYLKLKMENTVVRDHDIYCIFAALSGHMTGKCIPRLPTDSIPPATSNVHKISHTGNAADYRWIAEPGERYDNEIQPSFAAIKGREWSGSNPRKLVSDLSLFYSHNWWDVNFANSERYLCITPALELALVDWLMRENKGTSEVFHMMKDTEVTSTSGYLGSYGGWNLVKIHPEFLPKLYVDDNLVVDPMADKNTPSRTLRQVIAFAAYKNAVQVYEHFTDKRQEDGGVRFKGTQYVYDMSYDAWAMAHLSEGIVPIFAPTDITGFEVVDESFKTVANMIKEARSQLGAHPSRYPHSGLNKLQSQPGMFHPPFNQTADHFIDSSSGMITEHGMIAGNLTGSGSIKAVDGDTEPLTEA